MVCLWDAVVRFARLMHNHHFEGLPLVGVVEERKCCSEEWSKVWDKVGPCHLVDSVSDAIRSWCLV